MTPTEETTVVIVGAGVAGLTLGNFLLCRGIACVVLERRSRAYLEQRQRAGVIDARAVRMFRAWGLEERIVGSSGAQPQPALQFRLDGVPRVLELDAEDHADGRFVPQQVLVRNLVEVFLADGGDLRFDAEVTLERIEGAEGALVRYVDAAGVARTIRAEIVAGCDGDRGISRAAAPEGHLTRHVHEYGYAWLTVLAEVAPNHRALMAIHERGFAGQFARGPQASRFYLQCPLDGATHEWTDARIWDELETRFAEPMAAKGRIVSKQIVPIRSVVCSPLSYGHLYLLGDAAHLIPPMSAKGMSLALHDADVLAHAVVRFARDGDRSLLDAYSATSLRHVWRYQALAAWWTDLVHDAGDASHHGAFRHELARADFERLFTSKPTSRILSQFLAGLV